MCKKSKLNKNQKSPARWAGLEVLQGVSARKSLKPVFKTKQLRNMLPKLAIDNMFNVHKQTRLEYENCQEKKTG